MKDPKKLKKQRPDYVKDPNAAGDPDRLPLVGGDPESLPGEHPLSAPAEDERVDTKRDEEQ